MSRSTSSALVLSPAEQAVLAQEPKVAGLSDGVGWRLGHLVLGDLRGGGGREAGEFLFVVARGGEEFLVLDGDGRELLLQGTLVPFGKLGGAVVGDGEGGGLGALEARADGLDGAPAKGAGGHEGAVAGDDHSVPVHHDGLLLPEAREAGLDGGKVLLPVLSDVCRVVVEFLYRDVMYVHRQCVSTRRGGRRGAGIGRSC